MCGRYFQYGTKQEIAEFVRAQRITSETIALDYFASPTTRQPILRVDRDTGEREFVLMEWFKQKYLPAYATISARGERLLESNLWKTFMLKGQLTFSSPKKFLGMWRRTMILLGKLSVSQKSIYDWGYPRWRGGCNNP